MSKEKKNRMLPGDVQDETNVSDVDLDGASSPEPENKPHETHSGKVQRKAVALTAASLVNTLITTVSGMLIVRLITKGNYATYKQTFLAFNTLLPFLGMGLTQGLYYFLPTEKKRFRAVVFECYIIYAAMGLLFSMFLLLGGNVLLAGRFNNPDIELLLLWQIPFALITLMTSCTSVIMNIRDKISVYIKFNLFCAVFSTLTLTCALLLAPSAKTAVIAMTAAKLIEGVVSIILTIRCLPHDEMRPTLRSLLRLLYFSFPLGLSAMIGTITKQMDHLFITSMFEKDVFASYEVGAKEVPIVDVLLSAVSMALLPEVRRLVGAGRYKDGRDLYINVAKRLACITLPIMAFLLFWGKDFITFMYSDKYADAVNVFRVYLLYFLSRICVTGPLFTAMGMNKYLLFKTACSCALNAVLTYVFILWIGPIGAAVGTIASGWVIMMTMILPVLGKKTGLSAMSFFPFVFVGKLLVASIPAAAVSYAVSFIPFLRYTGGTMMSLIRIGAGGIVYLAMYFICSKTLLKKDYHWFYGLLAKYLGKVKSALRRKPKNAAK